MSNTITGHMEDPHEVVPFSDGKKYNLWALSSNTGNGYLKPDGNNLTASGKADTNDATECEWIAKRKDVSGSDIIYWSFRTKDGREIVANNQGVGVAVPVPGNDSNLFIPTTIPGRQFKTLQPKETVADNKFLGANGDGTMALIIGNKTGFPDRFNPNPQTLLMGFQLD